MKVLLFRTNGNKLDITKYNSQEIGLAKALRRKGIECDIAYYTNEDSNIQELPFCNESIRIYWLKGKSIAGNGFFGNIDSILEQYNVIQVSEYDQITSLRLAFFSKFKNKTVIYHGPYLTEFNKKYRQKCRIIDCIPLSKKRKQTIQCFAKSILAKDFLQDRGFSNILVTGVGLDIERLIISDNVSGGVKSLIESMKNHFSLLYIGNIEPRRNTLFLIRIMKILSDDNPDIQLIIVGEGNESYKKDCEQEIDRLGLKERIIIHNRVPQNEVSHLYKAANVFLLPSSYEIYGMVMMESMYYGLPVITTKSGGSMTVIEDGKNGFIIKLEEQKWAECILRLYHNSILCTQIGNEARKTILDKFTWDGIAEKMIEKYVMICRS